MCPNALLFVVDSGNQVIRRVSAFGMNWVVSTVAGLMGAGGAMNGTGAGAQFFFPAGIALDDTGELCVADSGNNTIRTTRVVPPTLRFTTSANQLILSWPTSATGFVLETAPTPTAGTEWSPLTNGVVIFGDNYLRTNDQNSGAAFYRLRKP